MANNAGDPPYGLPLWQQDSAGWVLPTVTAPTFIPSMHGSVIQPFQAPTTPKPMKEKKKVVEEVPISPAERAFALCAGIYGIMTSVFLVLTALVEPLREGMGASALVWSLAAATCEYLRRRQEQERQAETVRRALK